MDPVLICAPDDGFRCGAYDEFFFQTCFGIYNHATAFGVVLEAIVCHYGTFLGEAFHMLGFTAEERFWYQEGKVGVLHTCFLEHAVEGLLHLFPDGVAVGFDHHAAADCRLLGEVGFYHKLIVPLRVVLATFC